VRKFVAPALELIMLDKALRGGFDTEKALLWFGEMYAIAVAGDGHVGPDEVVLTVGGELGGGAALLRLATLHLLNQLLRDELKFGVHTYAVEGSYRIAASGENAARFMRLLASAPSAGGEYLSDKFNEFVKAARIEVRFDRYRIRLTERGRVAADLTLSEAGVIVKYNVYLRENKVELRFQSTDRSRVELAAILLRLAGVTAKVKREGVGDEWYVRATTDKLAAGHKELRDALANIVREAIARGWIDAGKAERWLKKLESGRVLREGWPKYEVGPADGALVVRYETTDPVSIEDEARRFRDMGLKEGEHLSVKMPEKDGEEGYVYIRRKGLEHAAWLSEHGSGRQRELAAEFVKYILERAEKAGEKVYEKAQKVVEEGKGRGSLRLTDVRGAEVKVGDRKHVVTVIGGEAEFEESQRGKKLLRIRIAAEVDGVRREYTITFSRHGDKNETTGYAVARADGPGGREADAERFSALIKALTGKEPRVCRMKDGTIIIKCYRKHLNGFKRFAELADAVEKWLEETRR